MRKGGLGILIFLIVALLVAFLLMKQMQDPRPLSERVADKLEEKTEAAAQQAVDSIGNALQDIDLEGMLQNSGLTGALQNAVSGIGGAG